jgi:hypothetical protein
MDNKMKAALIGGGIAGVLCIIPFVSTCCFLWALGGGFLAVFIYLKGSPGAMTPGDGAKLGIRAGIVGAIIYVIIALPIMLISGGAAMSSAMQQAGGGSMAGAGMMAGLGAFIVVIIAAVIVGFTTLGGLIGAAILGKGPAAPPPPPPPGAAPMGGDGPNFGQGM